MPERGEKKSSISMWEKGLEYFSVGIFFVPFPTCITLIALYEQQKIRKMTCAGAAFSCPGY